MSEGSKRRLRLGQQEIVFAVFAVLFIAFSLFLPGFLSADNMLTLLLSQLYYYLWYPQTPILTESLL